MVEQFVILVTSTTTSQNDVTYVQETILNQVCSVFAKCVMKHLSPILWEQDAVGTSILSIKL